MRELTKRLNRRVDSERGVAFVFCWSVVFDTLNRCAQIYLNNKQKQNVAISTKQINVTRIL